ncbi:MAG: glycosyltransferase, partial [Bacteroidota bacterium]
LRFIKEFLALLPHYECSLLFYFVGVSLGHLRAKQNQMVCDLRTGNVRSSRFRRWFFDAITYLELLTFRNKSFISRGLAQHFGMGNHHILPLGSSITPATERSYEHLHLFYVGTFSDRRMHEAIAGFGQFYQEHKDVINCQFTVVGSGNEEEEALIQAAIEQYALRDIVHLKGYVRRDLIGPFLQAANLGLSYTPITKYFDYQPVTKTYEYLLAGLPVLATATSENELVVSSNNGVLVRDNPAAVAEGLKSFYAKRNTFNTFAIQEDAKRYTYERIVEDNLAPYLLNINQHHPPRVIRSKTSEL